jgi:carbon monoxide dehydrogenase subunit G
MELNGTKIIAADVATVWAHLNNPDTLQACIPGCEELTGSPAEGFAATVKQKVGPVKATFKGAVNLENVVEKQSYTIVGEGKGGVAGFAKGGADVTLVAVPEGTELTYDATAKVGGKLAQLGNRIIGGFARKMADQFFENFQNVVEDAPNAGTSASSD